jgi:O-antigen/teichoic acid export membrane protein
LKSVSPFLKTQLIVVILTNASAVLNFLFQILISRKLDPKQLGIYFSVAAISQILFWIFNSVPQMVSHVMIFTEDQLTLRADSIKRLFKISLLFSAAIDVLVLLFAKKIQLFLNLESQLPVVFYFF